MMTENPSGLQPLGHAVLLRMHEPERKKGLIEIPDLVKEARATVEQQAEVVAIGSECWAEEREPRCAVGDLVLVTKFAGYVTRGTRDKQLYRLVNDRDIFCKIMKESEDE